MYRRLGRMLGNRLMVPMGIEPFDTGGYIRKVLTPDGTSGYDPAGLIGFWPQNEAAGGVSFDHSGLGHDGAYTAVNLGQPGVPDTGMSSAGYDGATSFNNIYSASLNTAFNGAEGTLLAWAQVANAGVWTDGANRYVCNMQVDAGNRIRIAKFADNNFYFTYIAGGITEQIFITVTPTTFFNVAITWNKVADQVIRYYAGAVIGGIAVGLGVWAGNLAIAGNTIGASNTFAATPWSGPIGPVLLYNTVKTPAEIAYLSTV